MKLPSYFFWLVLSSDNFPFPSYPIRPLSAIRQHHRAWMAEEGRRVY